MKGFEDLSKLTGLALDAQRTRLAALQREAQALSDQLAQLDLNRSARAASLSGDDPALKAGADPAWLRWMEQRKGAINLERARLAVRIEQEKTSLAQAFGRHQVAKRLARQDKAGKPSL